MYADQHSMFVFAISDLLEHHLFSNISKVQDTLLLDFVLFTNLSLFNLAVFFLSHCHFVTIITFWLPYSNTRIYRLEA
jgi:hypothetical protein